MFNNLLKLLSITLLLGLFIFPQDTFAQLTGTKNVPGDYATIAAAVVDLNTQGVGSGGVTFNVAAGYTESTTADITITATGTAGNSIVFQKSGVGANPLITRTDAGINATSTLGGLGDAIIRLDGTDYITFDGIDVTAADQGIEYGYLTHKPDGTNGCQFVTIKNSVVTMTKGTSGYVVGIYIGNGASTVSSATGVTVTAASGINSDITITGNTIQSVHAGIVSRGSVATGFSDNNVVIGQSGAGNVIQNFGGGNVSTTYAVYFIYVSNPSVAYNTINNEGGGGVAHGSTLYGIFFSSGITGNVVASNNAFTLANISTSSATQYLYSSNLASSNTFSNNTFAAGTISSTGSVYLIYSSSATPVVSVSGNATSGAINRTGASGSFYCYYNLGSPASGTETISNNNFSNITVTGTSSLYGIYSNTATGQNRVSNNNTISNWTGGTGSMYCLYHLSTTANQIYNNNIYDITTGGTFYGLYFSGTNPTVYNNNVYNITTSGTTLYGIYDAGTGVTNCYKNQVYNLTGTNASQTLYGFYITTGTGNYVYNNFVSDLKAPNSASLTGLVGMYVSGGTSIGLYYNTVFLNATSVGANFSASGIYASTTPTVDMRNNIVVNSSTPMGTGLAMAYRRSSTTLTSYSALSNNNSFYSGVPSATNLIYYDGTNSDQTLADFKTRVSPRDASSFSENVPFINSTTAPYNLHMNTGIATQTESGGTPVSTPIAVTDDFDGNTRDITTPDVGADEFAGVGLDLTAPIISYSPLLNTSSTTVRTLEVTVTDAGSGVPTTAPGWPNLYWRINSGVWSAVTPTSVTGSTYTFDFGAGVVLSDIVEYYVVAQDGATTPNIGAFPSLGAGGFTANPPAAATPPTTPSSYAITAVSLSGTYTVGLAAFNRITGNNITFEKSVHKVMKNVWVEVPQVVEQVEKGKESQVVANEISDKPAGYFKPMEVEEISWIPMQNGKPFTGDLFVKKSENPQMSFPDGIEGIYSTITAAVADLNTRGVSGATTFSLVDATYPTETFPLIVNVVNENKPTAVNTFTIKPATGITATISGSSAAGPVLRILNSYVTIDGSNASGTTRDLTIENTSTTTPQIIHIASTGTNPIINVTVKNSNLINGANTSSGLVITDITGTAGYFNNITLQNNSVQKAYIGIYSLAAVAAGNGTGLMITGNDLNISGANSIRLAGIYVQGVDGATVSNNNVGNFTTSDASNITGTWFATGTVNSNITNNNFGPINSTTGAPRGIVISSAVPNANIVLSGNLINELTTSYSSAPYGIYVFSTTTGVTVEKNQVSKIWNTNSAGYGSRGIHVSTGLANSNITLKNNFVSDVKATGDASAIYWGIGIGIEGATTGVNVYYNSVNLFGTYTGYTSGTISTAFGVITSTAASLDVRNNVFVNTSDNTNSATDKSFAINSLAPNTAFININNNDYYVNGTPGILGYLGADQTTLTAWQTATGKDANSISEMVSFTDTTNLHIPNGSVSALESAGTPIAGLTTDIDNQTRNVSTPDIGADEFNGFNQSNTLAGTYYIGVAGSGPGGTDPEFASLKAACDTLNSSNVSANTTFYVTSNLVEPTNVSIGINPGTYTVTFKPYAGTIDTITFAQVADNVGVSGGWVLGTPTLAISSTTNYGLVTTNNIIIDGSNTVDGTTRDLVIQTNTGVNGNTNPIRIIGDVNNCTLKNLVVQTNQSVSYAISITNRFFAPNNWTPDNIIVDNCSITNTISSSGQGLAISNSGTPTAYPMGMIFRNNDVLARTRGIFLNYAGNTDVYNNNIRINQTSTGLMSYGIWGLTIGDVSNVTNIYNNTITLLSTGNSNSGDYGIVGIEAGSKGTYNIYNNMISGFATTTAVADPNIKMIGIRSQTALVTANIYFNSIYLPDVTLVPGAGAVLYSGIYIANGTNEVKNNIVYSAEVDFLTYCIYRSGTSGTLVSDYNDFYVADTTYGNIGYWNNAATKTFVDWQSVSGLDQNSLNVVAPFTSVSDLHIPDGTVTALESAGTPIAMVTTDIDGQARNLSNPDIGADEFAGLLMINAPSNLTAVADTFAVVLNWMDNSTNELGFFIERKDGDSLSVNPFTVIDTVAVNVVSYNDLGRTPNTTYTYRVQAYNLMGVSPYSNIVTATTIIPVELTSFAANVTDKAISVTWSTATELNNRGFELERKLEGEWQKVTFINGKGTTTEITNYSYSDNFKYDGFQGTLQYRLKQIDFDGTSTYSKAISVEVDFTPKEYTLYQNYPNPFNPSTTIKFALPFDSNVRITIYNLLGEQVAVLFDQVKEVGYHNITWNASSLASGIYIYTIEAKSIDGLKNFNSVKKMTLIK